MTAPMAAKTCVRLGTPGPAPSLPWKETSSDRLLRTGGEKAAPGSPRACSSGFSERGAGAPGAFPFLLQPRTCPDPQGQRLPESPRNRARPLPPPRADDGASEPAWRWTRGGRPPA